MIDRRTLLIGAPFALSACATTSSVRDGTQVAAAQGVLALRLSGNRTGILGFNPYGESSFGARFAENLVGAKGTLQFIDGDRYLVLPVDAGEYMWTKLTVANQYAWLESSTRFRVRAASITYIGHIRIFVADRKFSIGVVDREADMREHLSANFPQYSQSMPFQKTLAEVRVRG